MKSKLNLPMISLLGVLVLPAILAALTPGAVGRDRPSPLLVGDLRCEYATNPIGVGVNQPRLSWILTSRDSRARDQGQSAYQILVADSEDSLKKGNGSLWDSGKVQSDLSIQIPYGGKPLASGQRAFWAVRVWDKQDQPTSYSPTAFWQAGLLHPEDWHAKWITYVPGSQAGDSLEHASWIWYPEGNPAAGAPAGSRYFRKVLTVPAGSDIKSAHFRVAVDNAFILYVNGKELSRGRGWTPPAEVDVKNAIHPGENQIAIQATNEDGPAGLIGSLVVETGAAQPIVLNTDRSWDTANTMQTGWQTSGVGTWSKAMRVAAFGSGPWNSVSTAGGLVPAPYLRKSFSLNKPIRRATLYASALGLYIPYINGQQVDNHIFDPGWTDYHRRVRYQAFDVTGQVLTGPNAMGMILGTGWYAGYVGLGGPHRYGPTPMAIAQLHVQFEDGSSRDIITDNTWHASTGPILASDLLMGETYDARKELAGWSSNGYDERWWSPVQIAEANTELDPQIGPPVRKMQELPARKVTEPTPGHFVFDLGQNMVGWARLHVNGNAGDTVTLRFAEMLNPDGSIYTTNYRGARCTDQYILKGKGEESFEPHFTFRGFRYVELTGYPGKPALDAVTGVVVHSDTPPTGTFECSSPMVNQLIHNITWGQWGNFLSVPTDCPQRDERLGWMGDAQIFVHTATYNADVAGFFDKWMVDVDDAQHPDGAFTDVSPSVAAGAGTAAWGDAGVICPWTIYRAYNDRRILEQSYPYMVRWVDYCKTHGHDLLRPAEGYGDWLSIKAGTPTDVLSTAYFAYSTRLVSKSAHAIGKEEDAAKYETLFQDIKAAFNKAYVSPDGHIKGDTQTDYVLALHFDLLPENLRQNAARYLVENIKSRDWHLSTGFVGVGYLTPTLTAMGYPDVAYRLLNNDTFPSWGYSIKYGATTIWERWDGWTKEKGFQDPGMNSFNHYSLGSVGEWLYSGVAGIDSDPTNPGYKHIIMHPHPGGGFTYAKATYQSSYGLITSAWKLDKGTLHLDIAVPVNTTATVYVPTPEANTVRESGHPTAKDAGVRFDRAEDGAAIYQVGSGVYHFTSRQ